MKKGWGFDIRDIDKSVRPQDDFYRFVNGGWLQKNKIPASEARWGTFTALRYDTEKKLRAIAEGISNSKAIRTGTPEQMIRDFYRSGLDQKRRNQLGLMPLRDLLNRIDRIKDTRSLIAVIAELETIGGAGPWDMGVDQDLRDSDRYVLHMSQGGLGMPDRDYYLKDDAESTRVRGAYERHIEAIFQIMGRNQKQRIVAREIVMRIETSLARISMRKEDVRDVDKTYHKMRLPALAQLAPEVDWIMYFDIAGAGRPRDIIVMQPAFFKAVSRMLTSVPAEEWKIYLTFHLANGSAGYLTSRLARQSFSFYGKTLAGMKQMKPAWRRALSAASGSIGEQLGRLYVRKHFSPKAKKKIISIADDLFAAYETRIRNLDWMSEATKRKAIAKLHRMNRKLGYPTKWKTYQGLTIRPDDFFGNAIRASLYEHRRAMSRLKKPVDRSEWHMAPQIVNAYYSLNLNDIVFPAAILQPPFFSLDADDALNYGCIGMVIGHEITHGFDDQGSKLDGKGDRNTWWTKRDRVRFEKKASKLVKQYDSYSVADGIKVNGRLTLGENIADLGGASIALDAYRLRLAKAGCQYIDGFTPEQRFFLGFAVFERENTRPEFEKMVAISDPHSPAIFRINGVLTSLPSFYEAFGVTKGDKLYREPKDRVKVW